MGSETPQPAHLLRPRNFNPHPYASQSHVLHSQDYYYGHLSPYQYQYYPVALQSSPERSPYNILKSQRGYLTQNGNQNNDRDREAYVALSKTAQKVLQDPQDYLNRKYAFEYTANDIYHTQQQDDQGLVKGSYEVPLPDGRVQIVQYTADNNGYHPEISYKGEVVAQQGVGGPIQQSPQYVTAQQQTAQYAYAPAQSVGQYIGSTRPTPLPVRAQPQQRGSVVVYPSSEEDVVDIQPPQSYYSSTTVTSEPQAVQYNNYRLLSGLPRPFGTVKTVGTPRADPPPSQPQNVGYIQYATYEESVDPQTDGPQYLEK